MMPPAATTGTRTAHDEARERERAGERVVGVAQPGAAMAARFAALGDDEIYAERFERVGFRQVRGAPTDDNAH
jgi:hypothetical protein